MYNATIHSDKLIITDDHGRFVEIDRRNGDADHLADNLHRLYEHAVMSEQWHKGEINGRTEAKPQHTSG
jgi:hypothetical protein